MIELTLNGTPYFVYASSRVPELTGKTALCRGPLVYCFEGADNEGDVLSLSVKDHVPPTVGGYDGNLLGGSVALNVAACRTDASQGLYTSVKPGQTECRAVAVPYYTWGNRGENQMRVWMEEARQS